MRDTTGYEAARHAVAVADLTERRGRLVVGGRHRQKFLHNVTSQDILAGLRPGGRAEALVLTPEGKLRAHCHVYDRGDDYLIDCEAAAAEGLLAGLDAMLVSEDVRLARVPSAAVPSWAALGPGAGALVRASLEGVGEGGDALAAGDERTFVRAGDALVASARRVLGADGLLVLGARLPAAAAAGVVALDDATLEVLRLEAGLPAKGKEIDERLLPQEAGLEVAVSFAKGCYVGQEAVAMLQYRGKVRRRLCTVVFEAGAPAQNGLEAARIFAGDAEVGRVTSGAVYSPRAGAPIAMAVLKVPHDAAGAALEVEAPGGTRLRASTASSVGGA